MTTIYLDAGALLIAGGLGTAERRLVRDDAERLLGHLRSCGHEVVLLGHTDAIAATRRALRLRCRVAASPGDWPAHADDATIGWLVTDSVERCAAARRHRRLSTVLVETSARVHDLAHRPADRIARSLGSAVVDIIAAEAMSPTVAPEPSGPAPGTARQP